MKALFFVAAAWFFKYEFFSIKKSSLFSFFVKKTFLSASDSYEA